MDTLVAVLALIISAVLAGINVAKHLAEKRAAKHKGLQELYKAPAERDSIIVQGAQDAVLILRSTLNDTREENIQLRKQVQEQYALIAEQGARIRSLELKVARLQHEGTQVNED